jgi:membrane fusion protein
MDTELFRTEVLLRQQGGDCGAVLQWEAPHGRAFLLLFLGLLCAVTGFAALAPVSRGEMVRGVLSLDAGLGKLHVPVSGSVQQVLVQEGQLVDAGQALLRVVPAAYEAAGPSAHLFAAQALQQQHAALRSQQALLQTRRRVDADALQHRRLALQQALALQHEQGALLAQRLGLAEQALERSAALLARRLLAPAMHAQALEAQVIARGALGEHALELNRLEDALVSLEQQGQQSAMEQAAEALRLDIALSQLQVQQRELSQQALVTLRAPVAGRVGTLLVAVGMPVEPGRPVLSLLPESGRLIAQLFVPSRAAGQLRDGQQLQLVYDAFPQSIHGSFPARIASVSAATVDPREYLVPFDIPEPVYLVLAQLDSAAAAQVPGTLRAGMQFSAQVQTGRESLLSRMTAPLRRLEPLL